MIRNDNGLVPVDGHESAYMKAIENYSTAMPG
jgi:hypothetical protein